MTVKWILPYACQLFERYMYAGEVVFRCDARLRHDTYLSACREKEPMHMSISVIYFQISPALLFAVG